MPVQTASGLPRVCLFISARMLNAHMTPDDRARVAPWLQPLDILLDAQVSDGPNAIDVLASAVGRVQGLESAPLFRALMRRELAGSTGLGNGFAIPHARIGGIERPITMFMRTKLAIPFHAPDGKPVSLFLGILTPSEGVKEDHLILLALVAELFSDKAFRDSLHRTLDPAAAADVFRAAIAQLLGTRR